MEGFNKMNQLWRYAAKLEWQYHPSFGWYETYLLLAERKLCNNWKQIEIIHDVTTKRMVAKQIASLCTENQLSPVHIRDMIGCIDM